MNKLNKISFTGPARWFGIYIILISTIAFILSSFKPKSLTDVHYLHDSTTVIKASAMSNVKLSRTKKDPALVEKTDSTEKKTLVKINPMKEYLDKYNAVDFSKYNFLYTIDYQDSLKNKTAIFYIIIQDIYKDNNSVFIEASKSFFGLNVHLRLKCKKSHIDSLKKIQFFTYAVVKIESIEKIYFNSPAAADKANNEITAPNTKNLLLIGECIGIFDK